jgi:ketosteroid isomerase-like protein
MRRGYLGAILLFSAMVARAAHAGETAPAPGSAAEAVLRFEKALRDRDLAAVEPLVSDDIVVFENGHRNDGWPDFRDNHLVPELKEPASPSDARLVTVKETAVLAWAYTRTAIFAKGRARKPTHVLWSVYVLEKERGAWKVISLDWSIAKEAPAAK